MSVSPLRVSPLCLLLLSGWAMAEAPEGQLTKAPELRQFIDAPYPEAAQAEGREGEVVLTLTIEADGAVSAVEITQPAGHGFDEAARAAAEAFVFSPAEIDGAPAPVQIVYRYAFTLDKAAPASAQAPDAPPTGRLEGTLLERGTREPLLGAEVQIPAHGLKAYADAQGRFTFEAVPAGEIVIEVRAPNYHTLEDGEEIRVGEATSVKYYVERAAVGGDEISVVGRRPEKEVTRRAISVEEIRTIPGTSGDALKVVQNLPGAARAPFGGGDLVMRGGGWTLARVNGHPINRAFHFGGLRSTVNSALIEELEIYPGNFGPEYGTVMGGVVDIKTRRPRDDGLHGYLEADLFDGGFLLEGPVSEKGALAISGRRSYIDALLPLMLPDEAMESFSVSPRYYDLQAVYDWRSGPHTLKLLAFGVSDAMVMLMDAQSGDSAARGELNLTSRWMSAQAHWDYRLSPDVQHHLSVSHMIQDEHQQLGPSLNIDLLVNWTTLREHLDWRLDKRLKLRGGVELMAMHSAWDVTAPQIPREGASDAPLASLEIFHVEREMTYYLPTLWLEAQLTFGGLQLNPSVRLEHFSLPDETVAQPRLSARYALAKGTTLKGGAGLYTQTPDIPELDEIFGNPDLKLQRAWHYTLGVEQRLGEHLSIDLVGFYKDFDSLIVDAAKDPAKNLENAGIGRAYGAEALLRFQGHERFYGWVAYTLMRSERRDHPGDAWRAFSMDQTHNLTLVAQYKLSPTWEVGARWRYVTGNPESPYSGANYDSDADAYVPIQGAPYSLRLPAFHQLDARVDKHWIFDEWRMTTYLEVQNAYNHENPEFFLHNYDYTERDTINGLPLIPSFGLRGSF